MIDLNEWRVTGRLTKGAELVTLPSGTALVKLSVAVNRAYKDKQKDEWVNATDYFDIAYYGESAARNIAEFTKGRQVLIAAALRQDVWEKDGAKHYGMKIIADKVWPLCRPGEGKRVGSQNAAPPPESQPEWSDAPADIPF